MLKFVSLVKRRWLKWFIAILAVTAAGLFFRTYAINPLFLSVKTNEELATEVTRQLLHESIAKILEVGRPSGISNEAFDKIVNQEIDKEIAKAPEQYKDVIQKNIRRLATRKIPADQKQFFLASDPFYYYYLTDNIRATGKISDQIKGSKYFDSLRCAPQGDWVEIIIHPYLGYYWYRFLRLFKSDVSLMQALCYFPLLFILPITVVFFGVCRLLRFGIFQSSMACLILYLAPIFIFRSAYGWYDTDQYNMLFSLLILAAFFWGLNHPKFTIPAAVVGGLFTVIHSAFWIGWPLIFTLVFSGSLVLAVLHMWKKERFCGMWQFAVFYFLSCGFFFLLILGPRVFWGMLSYVFETVLQYTSPKVELWPNIFATVTETFSIGPTRLLGQTCNFVAAAFILTALVYMGRFFWIKRERVLFSEWLMLTLALLLLSGLSLKSQRFALFLMIPASLLLGWGIMPIQQFLEKIITAWKVRFLLRERIRRVAQTVIFLMVIPYQITYAHQMAFNLPFIMNQAWYDVLEKIKQTTESNAVIYTWWPPGHFIKAIARRGVAVDGASQHLPENYWIDLFLITEDEREAVGILRMLYSGGNAAVDYLLSQGMGLPDAVDLIKQIIPLSREQAKARIQQSMLEDAQNRLLNLTHGPAEKELPVYVLVYSEMVEKNIDITYIADWNFRRAEAYMKDVQRSWLDVINPSMGKYIRAAFEINARLLRYLPLADVRDQDKQSVYFENGLAFDRATKKSWVVVNKNVQGQPVSLFYPEGNRLVEMMNQGTRIDLSALVYEEDGEFHSILADHRLIRSVLFGLELLNARHFKYFKPQFSHKDLHSNTTFRLFKIDWKAFYEDGSKQTEQA